MPELPEVANFARMLNEVLKDRWIIDLDYDTHSIYYLKTALKDYRSFRQLLPLQVVSVYNVGKKIVFFFTYPDTREEYYIVSSLSTSGKWIPNDIDHSNLWLTHTDYESEPEKVFYNDPMRRGKIEIFLDREALEERLSKIGPDLLHDDVSFEQWMDKVDQPNLQHLEICQFLMDQKHFSGVGNYIKSMSLYLAGVRPNAKLRELSYDDHWNIYYHVIDVIKRSYEAQGATLYTFYNYDGTKGQFEVVVYGQDYDPDGYEVVTRIFADGRNTHWVPEVQVYPSAWEGDSPIDLDKLDGARYTVKEMQGFCSILGIKVGGRKQELVDRLRAYYAH